MFQKFLPTSFVLYKPKDIVAGDFYWLENTKEGTLFAVADCTGHGVPGAMVSVVCSHALNQSVREFGKKAPGEILDKARELVINEFSSSQQEVKDGMDIALCLLKGKYLRFSGANNPLWIVRKTEVIELKPNKQPVGKHAQEAPFETREFNLADGDVLYLFSDGYADQFGGVKAKKFKSASLKKLLLSIHTLSMQEQRAILEESFEKWRGSLEQVDDVCIIGVRI
jgi:serine phosphatase RsbU (regulator of sigma subunit)